MSGDPATPPFQFTQTPHHPRQQCTARLAQAIYVEQIKEVIEVHIPCALRAHRITTRHQYEGTALNGAPVVIYWRDQ